MFRRTRSNRKTTEDERQIDWCSAELVIDNQKIKHEHSSEIDSFHVIGQDVKKPVDRIGMMWRAFWELLGRGHKTR